MALSNRLGMPDNAIIARLDSNEALTENFSTIIQARNTATLFTIQS